MSKFLKKESIYIISLLFAVLGFFFTSTIGKDFLEKVDRNNAWPFEFKYREANGKSPKISPNLAIISFDEESIRNLKKTKLTVTEWFETLVFLESLEPKAIIFNEYLDFPNGIFEFKDKPEYKFDRTSIPVFKSLNESSAAQYQKVDNSQLLKEVTLGQDVVQINGPHEDFAGKFAAYGDSNYENDGKIFVSVKNSENFGMFHLGLYGNGIPKYENGILEIAGKRFSSINGRAAVNFLSQKDTEAFAKKRNISLYKLKNPKFQERLKGYLKGKTIVLSSINKGSSVRYWPSPIGDVNISHIMWSVVNSTLTGEWIEEASRSNLLLLSLVFVGLVLPATLHTVGSILLIVLVPAALSYGGLYSFSEFSFRWHWASLSMVWVVSSFLSLASFLLLKEMKAKKVRRALTGIMPAEQIKMIASNPKSLDARPKEKNITIMFIDIIGFSLVSESTKPEIAFSSLKETLAGITKIIHAHGGVVDKTLGDGILCFFGGALIEKDSEDHARKAVECAEKVQKFSAERVLISEVQELPPFPVRIGINTSDVFIGNIGNEERYDFTIIGSGVNFAQRLEAACEPFKILVGTGTLMAHPEEAKPRFVKRMINIKHHDELIEAYEIDPFIELEGYVDKAEQIMRDFHSISRTEERINLPKSVEMSLETQDAILGINNFSLNGFAAFSSEFFGKKVKLTAEIKTSVPEVNTLVESLGINPLELEVMWGRPINSGRYLHGLKIVSLNKTQKEKLFKEIKYVLLNYENGDSNIDLVS